MAYTIDPETLPPELRNNPFFHFSAETHFVPAWDRIEPHHIDPAIDYAIALTRRNVEALRDNTRKPTFANTTEAFEKAFLLLDYFTLITYNMMPANAQEEDLYEAIHENMFKKISELYHEVYADKKLSDRILSFREQPVYKALPKEKAHIEEMYRNGFNDGGSNKNADTKKQLKKIRHQLAELGTRIQRNMKMAARTSVLLLDDPEQLKGISDFTRETAAVRAENAGHSGKWLFTAEREVYGTFMKSCESRELREKMWRLYQGQATSGPYNNSKLILKHNELQQKEARLLGYRSFAQMTLQYETAGTAGTVGKFLREIKKTVKPVARDEIKALSAFAAKIDGLDTLEPWDVPYYQERMKKEILGFDEEDLRPYFELENVLKGTFGHFEKLFGLHFEETKDYPVYHEDLRAFNVTDARTGKHKGVLFLDLMARDGKPAGIAWSMSVLPQGLFLDNKVHRPVDMVVCKFPQGKDGAPTLLTHDDVLTLFHELGHASHNLLSQCRYASIAGTAVKTDFVEFPSQIQENWAWEPDVLRTFAIHHKTGEAMPEELMDKLKESRKFMGGLGILDRTRRGRLDLSWSETGAKTVSCAKDFEAAATAHYTIMPTHDTSTSQFFSYRFGGGYDSCFYSYQWCQAMDAQAFALFERDGLYDRGHAARLRKVYEAGATKDTTRLFREFTQGRSVTLGKFFKREGLLSERFNYEAATKDEWEWKHKDENRDAQPETPQQTPKPAL